MGVTALCLLTVHAHPDDESSKGAGTVARYHAAGVRTVLVTATGGEEGDILNPAMDRPGVKERIHEIRAHELAEAAEIIGYDDVVMLGYRDSGMPDSPATSDPPVLCPGSARGGRGSPCGGHPPGAPAGDRHLPPGSVWLPSPRSPSGERGL